MPDWRYAHRVVRWSSLCRLVCAGLLPLAAAAASCASLPAVPSAGGPRWLRLESEHCELSTDEPEASAQQTSARIEQQHAALCQLAFPCAPGAQKLRVIALHDADQFEYLYGRAAPAAFSPELTYEPLLVLPDGLDVSGMAQLTRSLTLLTAQQGLGPLPPWLRQGLASYFETAHYDAGGAFVVGDAVGRHVDRLHAQPRLPTTELLNLPTSASEPEGFAASAWLLVHYLMSERRADFAAFRAGLASGQPLTAAFHEAFADLAPDLLDGLLDRYVASGSFLTQSKRFEHATAQAQQQTLSDADVYSLRAEVAAIACHDCTQAREPGRQQLEHALQLDPDHLRASILQAQLQLPRVTPEVARAHALATAHPQAWLAWVHLGYADPEHNCTQHRLQRLQTLAADNAHALVQRALCELQAGRGDSALALSRRAFAAYPLSPRITRAHMQLLHDTGACTELQLLQERGLDAAALGAYEAKPPEQAAETRTPCVTPATQSTSAPAAAIRPD